MKDSVCGNPVLQPGTGFTTKPGVAALRRTPGCEIGTVLYPNGVPQSAMPEQKAVSVMWNPVGVQSPCMVFPGVRRCHGDPRLCCETPLGLRASGSDLPLHDSGTRGGPLASKRTSPLPRGKRKHHTFSNGPIKNVGNHKRQRRGRLSVHMAGDSRVIWRSTALI